MTRMKETLLSKVENASDSRCRQGPGCIEIGSSRNRRSAERPCGIMDFRREFIEFAVGQNVLRFGDFKTKAGRCRRTSSMPACSMAVTR